MGLFKKKSGVAKADLRETGDDGVLPGGNHPDAPWVRAGFQHNDTFLRLAAQVANWRMFAFVSLGVALLGVGGAVYIGSQSKYIPMLVEVDKLGQTLAVKAVTGDLAVTDTSRLVYREMFELIENLRTVTTDRHANNSRLTKGLSRLSNAARNYVIAELKKAPPNEVGATKSIQVKVKTALKLTGKSWQIDWEEITYALNGEQLSTENWRATLQYELSPSGLEEQIRINPIGFVVPELSWQKVIVK
jgi:type IV secretion system protein VirB5